VIGEDKARAEEARQLKRDGYKTFRTLESALYHNLGVLPEPEIAHKFF